ILLVALSALTLLVGCGSSSPKAVPPPSGGFSNSNLNGTYTFSSEGFDSAGNFFAMAGSFAANGSGGITGGALDINDPAVGVAPNQTIASNSSYTVTADGRGTATLGTPVGNFGLDFVLTSSSHGLITRFDTGGSGSGSLDLQTSVALAGPYTFSLSGVDASGVNPLVSVGTFTVSGSTIAGVADVVEDINGVSLPSPGLTLTGSLALGSGTAPGTATLTAGSFTFNLDVYAIDSTHLKLIETDVAPIIVGDAFTQQTTIPSGQLVFTAAGLDSSDLPMAMGGYVTSDGASMLTTGLQDVNDAGVPAQVSFSGSFLPLSGGRTQVTLNGLFNGTTGSSFTFAAYPTVNGGIQLLEIDGFGITSGAAFAQTSTSFASPEGYGFNLSGSNSGGFEEDDIAEFTATSGSLTGIIDVNDEGSLDFNQKISGNFAADATANSGRGTVTTTFVNGLYYVVDGSNILFVETDNNQVGIGSFGLQASSSAQPALMMARFARVRPKGSARLAWRQK
ncbi:MAG: hypothetical protein WB562_19560, partial [Candidatus Sulfotelmatobacter sp.]